jgi:hypothetical protein
MKSALELHKDILQGLQTVDAFTQDMFLPEELDLHLNRVQDSFINELLDKGFADRQLRLDNTQDLIVKNRPLTVFISSTAFYYESGAVTSFLPGNYKHLLAVRAGVKSLPACAFTAEQKEIAVTEKVEKYFNFLPLTTIATDPPFYDKVELVQIDEAQTETVIASTVGAVAEKDDTYFIIRNLLFQANQQFINIDFYWEKYADTERQGIIKQNNFIITDRAANTYKLNIYNAAGDLTNDVLATQEVQEIEKYTADYLTILNAVDYSTTTLLDNKELYERKQNVFYAPKPSNPHTNVADGLIYNYYSDEFVIQNILIDYIREPQPISLALDQGCELSISGANIIVNRVVEALKLAIENPIYREVLQHNELRDQK